MYNTRQRTAIMQIIKSISGHFTVEDILLMLSKAGDTAGRTTVYRTLEKLADEGTLQKYSAAGDSRCYQYIGEKNKCSEHFHLKCEKCGKLLHIECGHLSELENHIKGEHGFKVNSLKTVLYGLCKECQAK